MKDHGIVVNRRQVLKLGGAAAVGALTLGVSGCGKNISVYTQTVIGSLEELLPLLPNQSARIREAISIAKTFDSAYRSGKFVDAATTFDNLATVVGEIANDAGVASEPVKVAIAVGGIALRAIAVLLREQSAQPAVAATAKSINQPRAKATILRLSDPRVIDMVVDMVRAK